MIDPQISPEPWSLERPFFSTCRGTDEVEAKVPTTFDDQWLCAVLGDPILRLLSKPEEVRSFGQLSSASERLVQD